MEKLRPPEGKECPYIPQQVPMLGDHLSPVPQPFAAASPTRRYLAKGLGLQRFQDFIVIKHFVKIKYSRRI